MLEAPAEVSWRTMSVRLNLNLVRVRGERPISGSLLASQSQRRQTLSICQAECGPSLAEESDELHIALSHSSVERSLVPRN